jgi:hypothetical protein
MDHRLDVLSKLHSKELEMDGPKKVGANSKIRKNNRMLKRISADEISVNGLLLKLLRILAQ